MEIEYLKVDPAIFFSRGDGKGGYMTRRVFRLVGTDLLMMRPFEKKIISETNV